MIISFENLKDHHFALSNIDVIYQKPSYRFLNIRARKHNGFLCITHGQCNYSFDGGEFTLEPGALVYLPSDSVHRLTITSEDFEFYRIDFQLKIDDEIALFSNVPIKITDSVSQECLEAIRILSENYQFVNNTVAKTELLCTIFRSLQSTTMNPRVMKLAPAIRFLHEHLTEGVNCQKLADLCCLSIAQFYNLFRMEYNLAPLEYRNRLLMQRATLLLKSGSITVTEASDMLGFESVAYFSRFFKKHQGISPSEYIKSKL